MNNCLDAVLEYPPRPRRQAAITKRQQELILGIADGMSTRQIAANLGISFKTAECHRTRVMRRLNLHSAAELVRYAIRSGLVHD